MSGIRGTRGAVVGHRYLLLDPIGTGGMSTVWRGRDLRTREYVALKLLAETHPAALLRFVAEQALRVSHPHLVTPYAWAADDDGALLAMPLVRGGTVAGLARRHGPLPEPFVVVLLDQLLQALDAIHRAGIVHRDVKPANLLLEPTGRGRPHLRLADFGVAGHRHHPRLTRGSGVVGTDGYLAPEQRAGAEPDPRQDLYAAGVVAVELLTGDRDARAGGDLGRLLATLTDPHPAGRPASAAAALTALRALDAPGAPWPSAGGPRVEDRLGPDPRPRRWAAPGGLTGLATGVAVGLALALSVSALVVSLMLSLGVGHGG